jgi:hypothetical protein
MPCEACCILGTRNYGVTELGTNVVTLEDSHCHVFNLPGSVVIIWRTRELCETVGNNTSDVCGEV